MNVISNGNKIFILSLLTAAITACGGCTKLTGDKDTQLFNAVQKFETQQNFASTAMYYCASLDHAAVISQYGYLNVLSSSDPRHDRENKYRGIGNQVFSEMNDWRNSPSARAESAFKDYYIKKMKNEKLSGKAPEWDTDKFNKDYESAIKNDTDELLSDFFGLPKGRTLDEEANGRPLKKIPLSDDERISKCDALGQRVINGEFDLTKTSDTELKDVLTRTVS